MGKLYIDDFIKQWDISVRDIGDEHDKISLMVNLSDEDGNTVSGHVTRVTGVWDNGKETYIGINGDITNTDIEDNSQSKNLVELICDELNIEIGKPWVGIDGNTYLLEDDGYFTKNEDGELFVEDVAKLLNGEIKPMKKPKVGDIYFMPRITNPTLYTSTIWQDDHLDEYRLQNGLVFKNKEDATEKAKELLEVSEKYKNLVKNMKIRRVNDGKEQWFST